MAVMRALTRFRRNATGAASIEFVVVFPLLAAILAAYLEMGWLMTKQMMLDRGLDMAMRDIRIAAAGPVTHDSIKADICSNAIVLDLTECDDSLKIQLIGMDDVEDTDLNTIDCIDRNAEDGVNLATDFATAGGARSELMFVRVCLLVDPILPGAGFGALLTAESAGNGFRMVSYSAFMNEPL